MFVGGSPGESGHRNQECWGQGWDREVMRHGTEVVLVREGGWAQDWAQKCCGRISLRWHRG